MIMYRETHPQTGSPMDLEAAVAGNVRRLREGRGLSQLKLGSELFGYGFWPTSKCRWSPSGRMVSRF